ncbi:MAG: tetratricopeptide repeat protein [Chloroherpetonaceae bacterium]|nr:tetratricopeptide repeat protein [Chthonomonadaceae bacterium]MDW8209000.1 tetratricopeptide repeat protein [Chloroherpetonaceae bacterium]
MMKTVLPIVMWTLILTAIAGITGSAQVRVRTSLLTGTQDKETVIQDLARLSDTVRVRVDADSPAGVVRVTFEIDDQFRAEVKQPPYIYEWDTLNESDGEHTIAVTAYNANGQTGVQRIKVKVHNELERGIAYYADAALLAFRRGDAIALHRAARKAMRINPGDPQAIRAMALSAGAQGDVERGFQMLDNRENNIPAEDPVTLEVRGFLHLVRGLKASNIEQMLPDIQIGLATARRSATARLRETLAALPESRQDCEAHLVRGDAYFIAGQSETAIPCYEKAVQAATSTTDRRRARHRLAMALLKRGRDREAETLLTDMLKGPEGNATSAAVLGALLYRQRKYEQAREMVRAGVARGNIAALIVATLADLAQGAKSTAYKQARQLVGFSEMPEICYVAQATLADTGDMAASLRYFQMALVRAPLFTPVLVSRAFEIMAYEKAEERFVHALQLFDLVLRHEPDNAAAIAGKLVACLHLKRYRTAQTLFPKLSALEPTAPDLFLMMAINLERNDGQHLAALGALERARKLDPVNCKDTHIPEAIDLIPRITRLRRVVPLTPALLDLTEKTSTTTAGQMPADALRQEAKSAGR